MGHKVRIARERQFLDIRDSFAKSTDDQGFDFWRREPRNGAHFVLASMNKTARTVLAVTDALLRRVARTHQRAAIIEDSACQ